jgi:hypothetical protein
MKTSGFNALTGMRTERTATPDFVDSFSEKSL